MNKKLNEVIALTNAIRLPEKKEIQITSYYVEYATEMVAKSETQLETYVGLKDFKNHSYENLSQYNRIDESKPKEIHQQIANKIVDDLKNGNLKIEGVEIKGGE